MRDTSSVDGLLPKAAKLDISDDQPPTSKVDRMPARAWWWALTQELNDALGRLLLESDQGRDTPRGSPNTPSLLTATHLSASSGRPAARCRSPMRRQFRPVHTGGGHQAMTLAALALLVLHVLLALYASRPCSR